MMQTALHQPVATTLRAENPVTPASATLKTASASSLLPPRALPQEPSRTVVTVYGRGQERIVQVVADILGKPWTTETSLSALGRGSGAVVVGILATDLGGSLAGRDRSAYMLVNMHCVDDGSFPDEALTESCDYEFLYSLRSPFVRRDLTRFLSLILGQTRPHEDLKTKNRTNFISTTFPDVHAALPNLDILSVGSDAVEIRVDLLVDPVPQVSPSPVPSLRYVGQQLMLLRQHTELPIIFTTRCTKENGKFPMDDPELFYRYLRRAIQWGVEYIDVELWLPEEIRRKLAEVKGNSVIMSAFHDFSGQWKWTSPDAPRIFAESAKYADIVKMIAMVDSVEANYELEYFRSTVKQTHGDYPLLSAVNMGQLGQLSRAFNTVFSPITHPLLPMIAAPGQLTAAEINEALHIMGQLPKRDLYAIGSFRATPQSMFMEKCFNELSLPHTLTSIDRGPAGSLERVITQPTFGGAALHPPINASNSRLPGVSEAARAIGLVDTIVVAGPGRLVGENATWKGIRATLTRDYVPSAYRGRAAIILASAESEASASIFALRSLGVGAIYTVGFRGSGPLAEGLEPFTSIQSVKLVEQPFVIVSALPPEKSLLVQPLLRHYRSTGRASPPSTRGKVYLDLTRGERTGDPVGVAERSGWTAYGIEDVNAWTTVETLRLLVGQNVPFDFVRMASGPMSRPTVSIDRLTPRRATAEPRESMNCKSCRKRKNKKDAVPKKRGPKTDVLEALLKRVDGLEKRLQDENHPLSPSSPGKADNPPPIPPPAAFPLAPPPPPSCAQGQPGRIPDAMLDTYFARLHGKPFFILDETTSRRCHQNGQLPAALSMAIYALTLRYTTMNPPPGSLEYARQARRMVDTDHPSIENLQTLLLLSQTFYAYGSGKKAYMTLANAISMVIALDLYRELPASHPALPQEREMRRRLFWAVYVMDRFFTCGSKRPCLVADHSILVRLPASSSSGSDPGDVFNPVGPNIPYSTDRRKTAGSCAALLVDISRILGVAHRYLAAGGVKGDSHFPWHALSNLSKIRQELDLWAAGTHDLFASIEALFGHPESTLLLLSKLIYHLVHCLLYRPFLPIDLAELRGSGQHQSWQIEATTLCFSHANAIAELVELARHAPRIEWPALVAYCLTVAGTVHIHGVHYHGRRDGEVFASSPDFLAREMHQLSWLQQSWTGVQHHRDLLTTLSACHADLVRTLAARPVRFAPVFHLEDFLDRYPGLIVDGSHVRLVDDEHAELDPQLLYASTFATQPNGVHHSHAHSPHASSSSICFPHNPHSPTHPSPWPDIPTDPALLSPTGGHASIFSPTLPTHFSHPQPPSQSQSQHPQHQMQYATFPFESTPVPVGSSPDSQPSAGPSSTSAANGTANGNEEKDPFLSLLEQIAENEHSQGGPTSTLPSTQILLSVLKESKSLPRETDTNPTSPTPDLPGPAQEKLLTFIRELQGPSPRLSTSQSETRYGVGNAESGIGLDALDDTDEKSRRDEEEYSLIQETVLAALPHPAVSPVDVDNRRRSVFDEEEIIIDDGSASARADNTRREQRETRRPSSSGSPSTWRSTQGRRPRNTIQRLEGLEKQFLNLISFLAFLTKDYLLLSPGVGERIAAEMIRDTLAHHSTPAWFGSGSPICVAGVALWLVIMGEELFERLRKASSRSASSGRKGFTPRKARGIPGGGATGLGSAAAVAVATEVVRDWETYITRLQFLSLREDLGIDARELAAEAAAVMRRVGS
ncbi:type I 3-dehydroquinase-domain-containing protein [Aspergillus egyptiacus]|nr:type I 3-dehydroquinase-domain-containing protein [Aspergillus egyptiacus]